jgi:uncharacterized repeat protein (TIGR03803 family)
MISRLPGRFLAEFSVSRRGRSVKKAGVLAICAGLALACTAGAQETVLYSFTGDNGDGQPEAGLIFGAEGALFGTTSGGGVSNGTVFELVPGSAGTWTEKVLYTFGSNDGDGIRPLGGVIRDAKGNLYGTTSTEGEHFCGGVFELSPKPDGSWVETILYQFGATSTDACEPRAGLIFDRAGNLYGTSNGGGEHNSGTAFKLSPGTGGKWKETALYSFSGAPSDGSNPEAGLIFDPQGNLYGTTNSGGANDTGGAVFELMPQLGGGWTEKLLYSFSPFETAFDGFMPQAGLIFDTQGNLYGTTPYGGKYGATNGTVFELSPGAGGTWTERILHSFNGVASLPGGPDGAFPEAGLIFDTKGNLFGTTYDGGAGVGGVVFELTPQAGGPWTEKIVHSFNNRSTDGSYPAASLAADPSGNLYGATEHGGAYREGTVFEIADPDRTATPELSLAAGIYTSDQELTVKDATSGAAIYYTTDGDAPAADSTKYEGPIKIAKSETVKAIAVAAGLTNSEIASAAYEIELPAARPEFSVKPGTYDTILTLKITDATPHAAIYYTTNGEKPTVKSTKYTEPIAVGTTETVRAIALGNGRVAERR